MFFFPLPEDSELPPTPDQLNPSGCAVLKCSRQCAVLVVTTQSDFSLYHYRPSAECVCGDLILVLFFSFLKTRKVVLFI